MLKSSSSSAKAPGLGAVMMVLGGVTVGLVLGAASGLAVAGAHDMGKHSPVDPNVNPCDGQKPKHAGLDDKYFDNTACTKYSVTQTLEQAGGNVTKGFKGGMSAGDRVPITTHYDMTDLCPVNVHWHLGAEHLSVGQFDEAGTGPAHAEEDTDGAHGYSRRQLAGKNVRKGLQCHHYKANDPLFTTPYVWKYCDKTMVIGETYEVHWPHSAAGACGTKWQYQTPFYDGVFCKDGIIEIAPLNTYKKIGVQGQVYTIVNDGLGEASPYHHDDMIKGMIVKGDFGKDIAMYTGSTTGTSRDNDVCSRFTPITWQVDRKCHMVSASSFDKMCKDMMEKSDDMSGDLHAHGARELVATHLVADNQQDRK
jgi:hypothetical protein